MSIDENDDDRDIDEDEDEDEDEDDVEDEGDVEHEGEEGEDILDPESLSGTVAALVDMYYLDEILVALAREIQRKGADDNSALGDAFRSDARALREAIGKLSGET
jgi:hypothetical protein